MALRTRIRNAIIVVAMLALLLYGIPLAIVLDRLITSQALTGLQLSVVASLLALVVGEQINATSGLGFMITQAQQFLNNSVIMVALIVYAILGLLLDGAVRLLQRRALAWRRDFGQ